MGATKQYLLEEMAMEQAIEGVSEILRESGDYSVSENVRRAQALIAVEHLHSALQIGVKYDAMRHIIAAIRELTK